MGKQMVLVTGGTGFLGSWCIVKLLQAGYCVRTSVRSLKREADVRAMVKAGGAGAGADLAVVAADLTSDVGWAEAVAGCTYVLHVASPFPLTEPKNENELVIPAVEGTLRVLRAARDASVKRVVVTSTFGAAGYGPEHADGSPFNEEDWTDPAYKTVGPYVKSKVLQERAAWDWLKREGGSTEMSVVLPTLRPHELLHLVVLLKPIRKWPLKFTLQTGIFGPVLNPDYSTSITLIRQLLDRDMPRVPRLGFGFVDVRDAADLHLLAMTRPEAAGERFLAVADRGMTLQEIGMLLKANMGEAGKRVPTGIMPDWVIWLASFFDPGLKQLIPILGLANASSNAKARRVLGWQPRSAEDAVMATAESLVQLGLVKGSKKK